MPDPSDAPVPEAGPMPRSLVLLLAVACALSVANVYYAQPLLDAIGREFGLAEGAVGIVVTATQLGCALALLFVVPLGDLLDRRRLMIGQLALLVLALAAVALAANTPWLLIGMVALGLLGTAMTQGLLALSAGIYSVPMYALIQMRSQPTHRARIIAANNILNALFMIASAVLAGALLAAGCSIPQVFLITGIANAIVALYVFLLVPEYLLRFVAWVITHFVYRFKVRGDEHIPRDGAAVLVCNHVSFVDAILLMAASPRPIHFVMDHRIFQTPVLGWLFKLAKAIPIAQHKEDPATYEAAFARAAEVLRKGDLLAIFPEGGITFNGELQPFKGGIMKILDHARDDGLQVPVIPMALTNLWGSYFSRIELRGGRNVAMVKPLRRGLFNRVGLEVGEPVAASSVTPALLQQNVADLLRR